MHHSSLRDIPPGYDVVVIGAGAAGMSAALFAAIRGARTLLVEKSGFVGGTSALSAGSIWIPNTRHASAVAASDSADNAERYLQQIIGNRADANLRAAFLKAGPEAVEVLENHSDVKLRAYPRHPDYRSELEGAVVAGRALEPLPFDGRLLGDALRLVRPPIPEFTLLGGMMVDRTDIGHLLSAATSMKSLLHTAKLLARYGRDRLSYPRGSRLVMGNALVGRLLYSLIRRDVDILTDTSLEKIVRDGSGRVTSAVLVSGGVTRDIGIDGGLILAGGGFNRHAGRRPAALGTDAEWSAVAPGASGDAQDKALEVGARISDRDLSAAFWAPASIRRRRDGSQAVFPHFVLDRGKPGTLVVDGNGRRFVNEAISYHQFALEMLAHGKSGDPGISHCGRGGVAEIRSRHGAPRRLGHARRPGRRISGCRRQHRATGATIEDRPRHFARDGRQHERLCANRSRHRIRPRQHGLSEPQWRCVRCRSQSQSRPDRDRAVLCAAALSVRHRHVGGAGHG